MSPVLPDFLSPRLTFSANWPSRLKVWEWGKHLICARYGSECFVCMNLYHFQNGPMKCLYQYPHFIDGEVEASVQFSPSVMSDTLQPHGLQHTRPPCPSPTLRELTQTHVHWVGDAIQLSHPLSSPSSPAFNLSQHQGLFKQLSSLHWVAKVLELQLQHESFQWTLRTDLL